MKGWIKLHRAFLEWEWFDRPEMVQIYLYLILKANRSAKQWEGITIQPGQLVTSVKSISKDTNLSAQTVRTCLNRLKSTSEITSESTNRYTIVTICKYGDYQEEENAANKHSNDQANKQATNKQQTTNKQLTTNKNNKNQKNKESNSKELQKKEEKFLSELSNYSEKYSAEMIKEFALYWTQMKTKTKMLFEAQPAFDISKRLATWAGRSKTKQFKSQHPATEQLKEKDYAEF